jgi:hypothetical protein
VGTNTSHNGTPQKRFLSTLREASYLASDDEDQSNASSKDLPLDDLSEKRTKSGGNGTQDDIRWGFIDNTNKRDSPPASVESLAAGDAEANDRVKILLLNGTHDRETFNYTALDFVLAITDALNYSCLAEDSGGQAAVTKVTKRDVMQDMDGAIQMSGLSLGDDGRPSDTYLEDGIASSPDETGLGMEPDLPSSSMGEMECALGRSYLVKPYPPSAYITHLLYPETGDIEVNVEAIEGLGIKCIKVKASPMSDVPKGHYGIDELRKALEPLIK